VPERTTASTDIRHAELLGQCLEKILFAHGAGANHGLNQRAFALTDSAQRRVDIGLGQQAGIGKNGGKRALS